MSRMFFFIVIRLVQEHLDTILPPSVNIKKLVQFDVLPCNKGHLSNF